MSLQQNLMEQPTLATLNTTSVEVVTTVDDFAFDQYKLCCINSAQNVRLTVDPASDEIRYEVVRGVCCGTRACSEGSTDDVSIRNVSRVTHAYAMTCNWITRTVFGYVFTVLFLVLTILIPIIYARNYYYGVNWLGLAFGLLFAVLFVVLLVLSIVATVRCRAANLISVTVHNRSGHKMSIILAPNDATRLMNILRACERTANRKKASVESKMGEYQDLAQKQPRQRLYSARTVHAQMDHFM